MKIGLISSDPGKSYGGTEVLIDQLHRKLVQKGHDIEIIYHASKFANQHEIIETIYEVQKLEVSHLDMVIAFRFPSYYVRHPRKLVWLFHQFRPLLDSYGTEFGFPIDYSSELLRQQIIKFDRESLGNLCDRLRVNSQITLGRLLDSAQLDATILLCPLSQEFRDFKDDVKPIEIHHERYVFAGGRISPEKRQHLAVLAAKHAGLHIVLAGSPENEEYIKRLRSLADASHMTIIERKIKTEELSWLYRNSLGVFYGPKNEDSYGFVAGESCYFGKQFITCSDSGDIVPLAKIMGFTIAEPNYFSLAEIFDELAKAGLKAADTRQIKSKWAEFSNDWEDVETWISANTF